MSQPRKKLGWVSRLVRWFSVRLLRNCRQKWATQFHQTCAPSKRKRKKRNVNRQEAQRPGRPMASTANPNINKTTYSTKIRSREP